MNRSAALAPALTPALALFLAACGPLARAPGGSLADDHPGLAAHHAALTVYKASGGTASDPPRRASATLLGPDGLLVTAAHVLRSGFDEITVTLHDGPAREARVVKILPDREIALIRITAPVAGAAPVADGSASKGDKVIGIGLAAGRSVVARRGVVRHVRHDGRFRFGRFGFSDPIVLDMRVESGFSGGPVFSEDGRWLGMIVGYELAREASGAYANAGTTYVLPADRILALGESYR